MIGLEIAQNNLRCSKYEVRGTKFIRTYVVLLKMIGKSAFRQVIKELSVHFERELEIVVNFIVRRFFLTSHKFFWQHRFSQNSKFNLKQNVNTYIDVADKK